MQISENHLDKLLTLFVDKRTPAEANSILRYDFIDEN